MWHYQFVPNDAFDWDSLWELILADINFEGQKRKVVMQMNRNGFLYVIDRTNGQLLSAKPFGKVNWATHVDMATGRPVESELSKKLRAGEEIEMWPSIRGAKNWPHAAFNPNTGLLYANTNHQASFYKFTELAPLQAGAALPGHGRTAIRIVKPGDVVGHIEAIDPMTAKAKWRVPAAGLPDLVGDARHRRRSALHRQVAPASSSRWTRRRAGRCGSSARAPASTRCRSPGRSNGKQYVTVLSGLGGLYGTSGRARLAYVPLGGSVWTFALPPD